MRESITLLELCYSSHSEYSLILILATDSGYGFWLRILATESGYGFWLRILLRILATDSGYGFCYGFWLRILVTDSGYGFWLRILATDSWTAKRACFYYSVYRFSTLYQNYYHCWLVRLFAAIPSFCPVLFSGFSMQKIGWLFLCKCPIIGTRSNFSENSAT
jgi:hypothetical protein